MNTTTDDILKAVQAKDDRIAELEDKLEQAYEKLPTWTHQQALDQREAFLRSNVELQGRIRDLETRQQELLQVIVRLTHETPFQEEIKSWFDQRAKLVAEVGTLRSALLEIRRSLLDSRVPGYGFDSYRLLFANILAGIEQALEAKP